MNCQTSFDILT